MTDKNGLAYQTCTKVFNLAFGMIGNLPRLALPPEYQIAYRQVDNQEDKHFYPHSLFSRVRMQPFDNAGTHRQGTGHHDFGKFLKGLASENRLPEIFHAVPTFFFEPACFRISFRYPLLQLTQGERFGEIFVLRLVTNHPRIHSRESVYALPSGHVGTFDRVLCPGGIYHYLALPPVSLFQYGKLCRLVLLPKDINHILVRAELEYRVFQFRFHGYFVFLSIMFSTLSLLLTYL